MRTCLCGFSKILFFSSCPDHIHLFNKVLRKTVFQNIFQKIRVSLVFQHNAAVACADGSAGAGVVGGLDDFVCQVVAEWCRNGQGLYLLGGHHPAKSHPAHVLQTGNATRTLPEVHTTITSPRTKKDERIDVKSKRRR